MLVVRRCQGFAYAPKWGPPADLSFLKVSPEIDLDGPQLDLAAGRLRWDIGEDNDWGPPGAPAPPPAQLHTLSERARVLTAQATSGRCRSSCGRTWSLPCAPTTATRQPPARPPRACGRATRWCSPR